MKLFTKAMTNRLQPLVPALVDADQSSFLRRRCIAENFVCTAELLDCCHKRKKLTIILKLDFHNTFDSMNWVYDAILTYTCTRIRIYILIYIKKKKEKRGESLASPFCFDRPGLFLLLRPNWPTPDPLLSSRSGPDAPPAFSFL